MGQGDCSPGPHKPVVKMSARRRVGFFAFTVAMPARVYDGAPFPNTNAGDEARDKRATMNEETHDSAATPTTNAIEPSEEKPRYLLDFAIEAANEEANATRDAESAEPKRLRKRDILKLNSKRLTLFCIQLAFLAGVCYLGSAVSNHLPIEVPSNICSMGILLSLLISGMIDESKIELVSNFLLKYMPVFFIPAGVTILTSLPMIGDRIGWFALVCVITTVLVFLSTALTVILVGRLQKYFAEKRAGKDVHLKSVLSIEGK